MGSWTVSEESRRIEAPEFERPRTPPVTEFPRITEDAPDDQRNAARGALTGIVLGAGMWAAILLLIFKH